MVNPLRYIPLLSCFLRPSSVGNNAATSPTPAATPTSLGAYREVLAPADQYLHQSPYLDSGLSLFKRDACSQAFGNSSEDQTCTPSNTLCCVVKDDSAIQYPQCQNYIGKGWCCTGEAAACYVDQDSVCSSTGSVPCSELAEGTTEACCPQNTTCATGYNFTATFVRCLIERQDLLVLAGLTTLSSSSSQSSTSTTSTSSKTSSASTFTSITPTSSTQTTTASQTSSSSPTATSSTVPSGKDTISSGAIAGIAIGIVIGIAICAFAWWIMQRRQKKKAQAIPSSDTGSQLPMAYDPYRDDHDRYSRPIELSNTTQITEMPVKDDPRELEGSIYRAKSPNADNPAELPAL